MIENQYDVQKKNFDLHIKLNEEEREVLERCAKSDKRTPSQMANFLLQLCCQAMIRGVDIKIQQITVDNGGGK